MNLKHKAKKRKSEEVPMEVDDIPANEGLIENESPIVENPEIDHISDDEDGGTRLGDIYIPPPPKPALTFDANGPRLIIKYIKNTNFKSYAGVQTLGPFHKSFTSIIGPNGSGKSNVIDSMLFVFGYRATKIRSKKVSVLIHSSSLYPNVSNATVEVEFCQIIDGEGELYTEVPNSRILVSRSAFKDNSSYYQLNGKRVQFKEVAKMLRSHGIDLDHNRFLILQGEVEQIAMMKPKAQNEHDTGMLEYLEDIIGTNRYKEPIEKVSSMVEALSEARKEKLVRVRGAEAEWRATEAPMRAAVDLANRANRLARARHLVLQKYIHEGRKIVDKEEAALQELKQARDKILEKLSVIQEELTSKRAVLDSEAEQYNSLKRQRDEAQDQLRTHKRKLDSVQADLTQANKKIKNLNQLIEQEKGKLIEFEMIPEKNTKEIEECEKLLERHQENKRLAEEELQTVMAGVRATTQGLQEQKHAHKTRLASLQEIVADCNNKHKMAESDLKLYLSTETRETKALDSLRNDYNKAKVALDEKKASHKEISESIPAQERELSQLQTKLQHVKAEEETVLAQATALREQCEESRQAMTARRSRGRVLDSLMEEKRNGNLPGIYGRLGDLGAIDSKYDVAISTCCGALDHILVDTVDTARAAVDFLKKNDIGRVTFIALDKQEHFRDIYERPTKFPEGVPRLFDLIRVKDERVRPAFYFALRDTLLARDLEQATRIAYGLTRYRVVSLQGDVIELAGTMSGGGRSQMRGRMASSVQQNTNEIDPAVMQANENKLGELENRLSELRNEQYNLENAITKLQRTLQDNKNTLRKLNIDLNSLKGQLPHLKTQIEQQERKVLSVKVDPDVKTQYQKTIEEAAKDLESATNNAEEVERLVQEVEAEIKAVAGDRVGNLRKNVDDLVKKIDKINKEVAKLKVAISTSKRNATQSKNKITHMETDLKETEANITDLKEQKKQLLVDTTTYQKKIDELEEQIGEGTGQFSHVKQEISKLQQREDKRKGEKVAADNAVSKKEKSLHEYRAREPAWRRDLESVSYEEVGVTDLPGLEPTEPLTILESEELDALDLDELRQRLDAQKALLGDNKPNIRDIQEYKNKEQIYMNRVQDLETITAERNRFREFKDNMVKKRNNEFMAGFRTITAKLKEMYQMITLGGDAELELVDSLDPFTEGVTFSVRPPNKSWKNISNLSGGEKTLSSLALVFALHYYKPTPLYVMDEIDAALDFKNVSIVANYIKERTRNAQFIIISLRYNMFEVCNRLIGIYKTSDCTKSVTINNCLPKFADELRELTKEVINGTHIIADKPTDEDNLDED